MGGKVIKINLMGAIGVVLLIIASIIGIIVFVNSNKNNNNSNSKQNNSQNTIVDDKSSYKELDRKEIVIINGLNKEVTFRTYEKFPQYKIDYAVDSFYVDDRDEFKQYFESQVSDSIVIEISKTIGYQEKRNELITYEEQRKGENNKYKVEKKEINGHECYLETKDDDRDVLRNYYIESENEYFAVKIRCGKEYADTTIPIIEKMMETFQIM